MDKVSRGQVGKLSPETAEFSDCYQGVELAPCTIESLVTWDVSGHARLEQDRLSSAYRPRETIRGGY